MSTPKTSSKALTDGDPSSAAAAAPHHPIPERVRRRLEAILAEMRAQSEMAWDSPEQLLYQTIFPDMTYFLSDEEGARYRAEFETEWKRLEAA